MTTLEEQIKNMYTGKAASDKEQLTADYQKADSELTAQQQKAQKATDANLTRTAVEAQKAAVNNSEYYAAAGLSSGAKAQARLSQENQLQADLTALRAQQQQTDADIERQRGLLGQEYASAIRKAQSDNDLQMAQALYGLAEKEDERLWQERQANLQRQWQLEDIASQRDYEKEVLAEDREWQEDQAKKTASTSGPSQWDVAKFMAEEAGDYTLIGQMLGYDQAQINQLNGVTASDPQTVAETTKSLADDSSVKPVQTEATTKFVNSLPSWQEVQISTPGYKSYSHYIATAIVNGWEKGHYSDGEAKWLINRYGVWSEAEQILEGIAG